MNPIGIMQGRLSPPRDGRIQSFPVHTWRNEFFKAQEAGLACIEWIYEYETESENPLRTPEGIHEIKKLIQKSGVQVWSICADHYMTQHLILSDGRSQPKVVEHLKGLISRANALQVRYMVLPFVDASSLKSPEALESLVIILKGLLPLLKEKKVELHLETDLSPQTLLKLLERVSFQWIKMNYDIGNAASLGHDPSEELSLLGSWLGSVHVKDRLLGGGTVLLGSGHADFPTCFRLIQGAGFQGPFILQAARNLEVGEMELAKQNRQFVERHLGFVMSRT
ncbi:MAG: TIM barrel protein [Chlamydiae bacterium]|nr:TIM barrel protein [Chlamydiota bacterium]MBI3276238.1 TIM barrel protein [Chlamydiota bacterium]